MKTRFILTFVFSLCAILFMNFSCDDVTSDETTTSRSGVKMAQVTVQTDLSGKTIEQNNIAARYAEDNKPGSIKHLYIISAYSGQVMIYSTVKGKVTSSGKRLSPGKIARSGGQSDYTWYNPDLIEDDGTFGPSVEYIYWWDSKGVYHQQYIAGGMCVHISNQPLAVKNITINMELK